VACGRFQPGFRFSQTDAILLLGGAIGAAFAWREAWWAGFSIIFVVLHFFLFCNVFRIARIPELMWAAVFVLLTASRVFLEKPSFGWVLGFTLLLTIFLIWRGTRKPGYHGIFWKRWNPELRSWWENNGQAN